jgi:hypothetical protein
MKTEQKSETQHCLGWEINPRIEEALVWRTIKDLKGIGLSNQKV